MLQVDLALMDDQLLELDDAEATREQPVRLAEGRRRFEFAGTISE
jgi:hypothetical protein